MKIQKKIIFFWVGGRGSGGGVRLGGGQDGCERKIEVFVKTHFCFLFFLGGGRSGWGVRVDVNEAMKFLGKFNKKMRGGGPGGRVGGSG